MKINDIEFKPARDLRERQRQRERERERDRQTESKRETERQRDRETERQRERQNWLLEVVIKEAGQNIKLITWLTLFQIIIPLRFTKNKNHKTKKASKGTSYQRIFNA